MFVSSSWLISLITAHPAFAYVFPHFEVKKCNGGVITLTRHCVVVHITLVCSGCQEGEKGNYKVMNHL